MTTEERKSFDDFKRELSENPIMGLNFFGNMDKVELDNVGDLITRNRLMSEAKNKFICQHLGINYRKEDFEVSDEDLAKEWAKGLPDKV